MTDVQKIMENPLHIRIIKSILSRENASTRLEIHMDLLDVTLGQLRYHLNVLVKNGVLMKDSDPTQDWYIRQRSIYYISYKTEGLQEALHEIFPNLVGN